MMIGKVIVEKSPIYFSVNGTATQKQHIAEKEADRLRKKHTDKISMAGVEPLFYYEMSSRMNEEDFLTN
jgi:hypothetical protein